jgi:hypothetical protein
MGSKWFGRMVAPALLALAPMAHAADAPPPAPPSPAVVKIGAAYVAKQFCSCLFLTGRSETSCRAEFKPQIDAAKVDIDRHSLPARAKVGVTLGPILAEAAYSHRYGCVLVK